MLNKDQLLELGYEINPDPDQPGMFYWKNDTEGSEISFDSEKAAMMGANLDAIMDSDLHVCDNCGKIHTDEMLLVAKDLGQRVAPGGVYPSGECSDCGALCYPDEALPGWDDVMNYFGLDRSFMYTDKHVADYTLQYIEGVAAEEKKARAGEMAIAALARIRAQPNCRHEVEAQLGEETWEALSGAAAVAPAEKFEADYTVAVEVEVTAESHEEAARLALDDLRDRSLQEWNMTVTNSSGSKVVTVPGNPEEESGNDMQVSLDGGVTWQNAPNGVRVVYRDMPVPGEDENGELHINATPEGLVTDVWVTREEPLDHNIGTSSQMATDIVAGLVEAND